jgi:hypothetical protein
MFEISVGSRREWLLIVAGCLPVVASVALARGQGKSRSLKGHTLRVGDLKVTVLNMHGKATLPCMLWANSKGSAFLALEGETGVLRRISFPSFAVTKEKDFERKFAWMSLSGEGLVLSERDSEEIWVVDPESFALKSKIHVPKLKRAASAQGLPHAVACDTSDISGRGQKLYVVDLGEKTLRPYEGPGDRDNPAVTPDGGFVFTQGGQLRNHMSRFSFKDGTLNYEEGTQRQGSDGRFQMAGYTPDNTAGITISPDSKLVCEVFPFQPTTIHPVETFDKVPCTLEHGQAQPYIGGRGGPPMYPPLAMGFDLAGGSLYTQSGGQEFLVCTLTGVIKQKYKVGIGSVKQFLVHPLGHQVILLRAEDSSLNLNDPRLPLLLSDSVLIELPQKK